MKTLNQDAARFAFLLDLGMINADEVIKWADDAIIKTDKPSSELIEVSVSSLDSPSAVSKALHSIVSDADIWRTIEDSLPAILVGIERMPNRARMVATEFYHIACTHDYTVPDRYSFFLSAEDNFELAESGVFVLDDVYSDFIRDIRTAINGNENH